MKILIIHTFGLGDMIMFTPTLKVLQEKYPSVIIDFLIFQKASAEPIKNCKNLGTIYYSSFNKIEVFKNLWRLRQNRYDISISTSGTHLLKAKILALLAGAKKQIGEFRAYKEFEHRAKSIMDWAV